MATPLADVGQSLLEGRLASLGLLAVEPQAFTKTGLVVPGECLLAGYSINEPGGISPCTVDLFDGQDTGGTFIMRVSLNPGQTRDNSGPYPGIHCEVGLFANLVTGAVNGSLWVVVV